MYRYYVLLRLWFSSCCWSLTICDLGRDVHYVNLLSIMCRRLSLVVAFLFHISVRDSLLLFYILYFFSFPFHNKDDFDGTRLTSSSKLFFFFSDPLRFIHFYTLVIFLSRKVKWITSGASSFVFLSLSLSLCHINYLTPRLLVFLPGVRSLSKKTPEISSVVVYFGYSAMAGIVMFLMCGAMGFTATYIFVRTIFGAIKVD